MTWNEPFDLADLAPDTRCRTYQLLINSSHPMHLVVGRLGAFDLPPGSYVYTGSARGNLQSRVRRHLRPDKRLHWHIDYLLAAPGVRVSHVRYCADSECTVNQATHGRIVIARFGASDCRAGCGSHLKLLGKYGWQQAMCAAPALTAPPGE